MQLDAEDDGMPFGHQAPPAGIVASPAAPQKTGAVERPTTAESEGSGNVTTVAAAAAAAAATADMEE